MRKLCLATIVVMFSIIIMNAQDTRYGATAGFLSASAKLDFNQISVSNTESGFYVGAFVEIGISDKFKIQPELLYASTDGFSSIQLPIMTKYYVSEKFNLQGGLQFNLSLEETSDDISAFTFGLGLGTGYDITEDFLITARYAFQLNDSYTGEGDISSKTNLLNIGLGYRF